MVCRQRELISSGTRYVGMACRVIHDQQVNDAFQVKAGMMQGFLPSPRQFLLALDLGMKTSTRKKTKWYSGDLVGTTRRS
ncbi:hypothetical protein ElyMa_003823000 [Elysia marginata]|uniref:Uncharacterized protein n=1 Tax=Elysia marginata TaxID=1093978 RepID=A0AAV4FEX9_9GAST|nr:hypothetical protein ElyMa_003823000 [Elysia marginata]